MATTGTEAFEAILAHHAALADGVDRRVAALRSAVGSGARYGSAAAELVAYLAAEVLPHAKAEERTVYRVAAEHDDLAPTVAGMVDEHRRLASSVEQLATASSGAGAVAAAEGIGSLFAAHVAKENELLLPSLAASGDPDLPGLLAQMHRVAEADGADGPSAADPADPETAVPETAVPDAESHLLRLLLDAAGALAEAGRGDRACRLVAEAWAVVRTPRPELAVRVTVSLHRLVRSVTAEQVTFSSGPPPAGGRSEAILDVRSLAPAQRHEQIFSSYGALGPGAGFVLVNDHDPKPLRYQFEAEHAGRYSWDYLSAGPDVWKVRIGRVAAPQQ